MPQVKLRSTSSVAFLTTPEDRVPLPKVIILAGREVYVLDESTRRSHPTYHREDLPAWAWVQ